MRIASKDDAARGGVSFQLLELVVLGDEDAARYLVGFIYKVVVSVLKPTSPNVEDATNDAFMKVLRAVADGKLDREKEGKPSAWATKIAINVAIDYLRHERRVKSATEHFDEDALEDSLQEGPDVQIDRIRDEDLVQLLLTFLNEEDRALLVLRYWEELSFVEIGKMLDIPENTAKARAHRAMHKLYNRAVRLREPNTKDLLTSRIRRRQS